MQPRLCRAPRLEIDWDLKEAAEEHPMRLALLSVPDWLESPAALDRSLRGQTAV